MGSRAPIPTYVDHMVVSFSDIEMGAGGVFDDFPHSDFLAQILLRYNEGPYRDLPLDVVFNGDTFDLLKTNWQGAHPHLVDAEIAVGKMNRVADAHPDFFAAIAAFLAHPHAPRRVHFVVGNHDTELLFSEVQQVVIDRIGRTDGVEFPGFEVDIGDIHIEHGQQADPMFAMRRPFIDVGGRQVLDLSWGAVALLDVALDLRPILYHHDRLKPRDEVFRLLPEAMDLIVGAFWQYWTKDFWRGWFNGNDPVKHLSWTMLREVAYRFTTRDGSISVADHFIGRMNRSNTYGLYIFGHEHESGWWTNGRRKVLRTGALRNEFMVEDGGRVQRPIPKVWAEALLRGGRVVRSHLVEVEGPPAPEGYVPDSIFTVLEHIRPLLGSRRDQDLAQQARRAQEAREDGDLVKP